MRLWWRSLSTRNWLRSFTSENWEFVKDAFDGGILDYAARLTDTTQPLNMTGQPMKDDIDDSSC